MADADSGPDSSTLTIRSPGGWAPMKKTSVIPGFHPCTLIACVTSSRISRSWSMGWMDRPSCPGIRPPARHRSEPCLPLACAYCRLFLYSPSRNISGVAFRRTRGHLARRHLRGYPAAGAAPVTRHFTRRRMSRPDADDRRAATGQPSQTCGSPTAPDTPGAAAATRVRPSTPRAPRGACTAGSRRRTRPTLRPSPGTARPASSNPETGAGTLRAM
jgi:hypothetical protein